MDETVKVLQDVVCRVLIDDQAGSFIVALSIVKYISCWLLC